MARRSTRRRTGTLTLSAALSAVLAVAGSAAPAHPNPVVTHVYTADPAALVHDGVLYVHAGRDQAPPGHQNFVMNEWRVLSTTDLVNWTDHGSPLSVDSFAWANADAWASEVVQGPDGRFYWYVSINGFTDAGWMNIGVAVADTPVGPFTDALDGPLISDSTPNSSALNIDPTVFVDDDDQAYMYWGSFWSPRVVALGADMISLAGPVQTPQGLDGFWEAPWMFARDGVYYLAYASNSNIDDDGCVTSSSFACIRYATASSPLGPWTHQGIVLDQVSSTTNHPAIVEYGDACEPNQSGCQDQWYMVYHTADAPGGGDFRRSVAIDELYFNADGTMQRVVQTSSGPGNLAPQANVTCSHTSPWESCQAVNSGQHPTSSNISGPNQGTRWGTWPQSGEHWVQLNWPDPVTVSTSHIYFFQDTADGSNDGVKRPASWHLQYWDGAAWVDVDDPSGHPTALEQYNATTFTPVSTTGLRANVTTRSDADGVGVLQWRVSG